jgi:CRISPR-associated protein Csb2
MPSYLCVTIRFLDPEPSFHGRRDGGDPEWPPSPLRVFQSLVDAAASRWRAQQFDDYARPALTWLEGLPAPVVYAPDHHLGVPVRIAVPNNDLDAWAGPLSRGLQPKKQPNELKTMKTVQRAHLRGGNVVRYLWAIPESGAHSEFVQRLEAAARSVTHLGWGVDMVAGNAGVVSDEEVAKLEREGERWERTADGSGTQLRVPRPGTLDALIDKHKAFLNRLGADGFKPVPPLTAFETVGYRRSTEPAGRAFAAFRISAIDPDQRPPAFDTARRCCDVAGWVRHATAQVCEGWPAEYGDIAAFVHGHDPADLNKPLVGERADERFMYLPLPSIERRGDKEEHVGMIRRVLVAAPPGTTGQIDWVRRRLPGQELTEPDGTVRGLLGELPASDWVLGRYVGASRTWSTVAPVIRPGHDEGDAATAERLLRRTFEQAGLSRELVRDAVLEWRHVGFRAGVDLVRRYQLPATMQRLPAYHVRVRFLTPVKGPLAVGAGRYRGFGLFVSDPDASR